MYAKMHVSRVTRRLFIALSACGLALPRRAWSSEGTFIQDVAWSPDGSQLVFSKGDPQGPMHLFLIHSDGSSPKQITSGPSINLFGAWSVDGTQIAFRSNRDGQIQLYVMRWDGSNLMPLTTSGAPNSFPSWAPDGSVAFNSKRTGKWQIFKTKVGTSSLVQITHEDFNNENPVYSPDGLRITFQSNRLNHDNIYVVNSDGSGERLIMDGQRSHVFPSWKTGDVVTFSSSADAQSTPDAIEGIRLGSADVEQIPVKVGFFVRWDRAGRRAAIIAGRYPATHLFCCDSDGSNLLQLA